MLTLATLALPALVASGDLAHDGTLVAQDAQALDYFGSALALDGDTLVVGAPLEDTGGNHAGAAYVFVRAGGTWSQQAKLTASDAAAGDAFGSAVGVDGDTLIVGAPFDEDAGFATGAIYVFVRSGGVWTEAQKLVAEFPAAGDRFGSAVAIDSWIVAGAPYADGEAGRVHIFNGSGGSWSPYDEVDAGPDAGPGERFGADLALHSAGGQVRTFVVGARYDDGVGAAYVFHRQGYTWSRQARLGAPDVALDNQFGAAVGLHQDTVVVGAPGHDLYGSDAGAVYTFEREGRTWSVGQLLVPQDVTGGDRFGMAAAVGADAIVAGSRLADIAGADAGAAFVYRRAGPEWYEVEALLAPGGAAGDGLGLPIAISGERVAIGAYAADSPASDAGEVHVWGGIPTDPGLAHCFGDGSDAACPCGNLAPPGQGCRHSGNRGAVIAGCGSTSIAADDLALFVYGLPPGNSAIFYAGTTALVPGAALFDGLQCAGGDVRRFRPLFQTTGVASDEDFVAQDPSGVFFVPGARHTFQLWTRDVAAGPSPCGTGATFSPAWSVVMTP